MTTLPNRPQVALVVIAAQNDVLKDAYARDAVIAHTNLYCSFQTAPGLAVRVVEAVDVAFG